MSCLAKTTPSKLTRLIKIAASVIILDASAQADRSPSFSIFCEKTVMKAVERAPSAKRSRSKLGARKAISENSHQSRPNRPAKRISRISPSTREHMTATAITPLALVLSSAPVTHARQPCETLHDRNAQARLGTASAT